MYKMHNLKALNCIFFSYFVLGSDVNMYHSLPCLAINLSKRILGEIYEIYTVDGSEIRNDSNIQVYCYYWLNCQSGNELLHTGIQNGWYCFYHWCMERWLSTLPKASMRDCGSVVHDLTKIQSPVSPHRCNKTSA